MVLSSADKFLHLVEILTTTRHNTHAVGEVYGAVQVSDNLIRSNYIGAMHTQECCLGQTLQD